MSMENQINQTPAHQSLRQQQPDDEIDLMGFLLVIAKHNRFIIKLTLAVAVLALIFALTRPNIYTARTVIMPPQQQGSSSASMLLGQLGGLAGMAGGAMGIKNQSDLYIGMLKSESVANSLVQRFKLMEQYKAKFMDPERGALAESTVITAGKDGFITLEFSDTDPNLAASVANAYVEELNNLILEQAANEAESRKLFYEKQLNEVRAKLAQAELEMKVFQEQNRIFRLGGTGVANVGAGGAANISGSAMVLGASGEIPKAELEFVRISREVKYLEMLLGAMAQQVTTATIDAAKNSAVIHVLDKAQVPAKKSKPKRALTVILATLIAFFAGVILAFVREAWERGQQNPEQAVRVNLLRHYLRKGK